MSSKLAVLRRSRKITQVKMAEMAGISQTAVSLVEGRRLVPGPRQKEKFIEGYGIKGQEGEFFDSKTGLAI